MPRIVVIGAGVLGLSSAVRLLEAGHAVTVVARDLPQPMETADPVASINYTSLWAGAHNRFVPPPPPNSAAAKANPALYSELLRDHGLARETTAHMTHLADTDGAAGVTRVPHYEYIDASPPPAEYAQLVDEAAAAALGYEGFRLLGADELPAGASWGCLYDTWCVNPMVYCAWLVRRFALAGGKIRRHEVAADDIADAAEAAVSLAYGDGPDAATDDVVVVNCSGVGFNDPAVFITRGQTCVVAEPIDRTISRQNADGTWTFCIPRGFSGGTIIGGTREPNDWTVEPSPATRALVLDKFVATYPGVLPAGRKELTVRADIVGRRPTRRGGMRLEAEAIARGDGRTRIVVHAYGVGGRGYELSWGTAGAVKELVGSAVPE